MAGFGNKTGMENYCSGTAAAILLIDSPTALFADVPPGTDPAQYELPAAGSGKLTTAIATGGGWVIIRGS